ncbi:MAG: hypothetical protein U0694_00660 [Anaerolineae bacterium]
MPCHRLPLPPITWTTALVAASSIVVAAMVQGPCCCPTKSLAAERQSAALRPEPADYHLGKVCAWVLWRCCGWSATTRRAGTRRRIESGLLTTQPFLCRASAFAQALLLAFTSPVDAVLAVGIWCCCISARVMRWQASALRCWSL